MKGGASKPFDSTCGVVPVSKTIVNATVDTINVNAELQGCVTRTVQSAPNTARYNMGSRRGDDLAKTLHDTWSSRLEEKSCTVR